MAKTGEAATSEELRGWPFRKLISEIRKQIRRDVGGNTMFVHYRKTALDAGMPIQYADLAAKLQLEAAGKSAEGSRKRIESKLIEIQRRWDLFGKAYAVFTNGQK